ncbi:hypothetical protein CDN99_21330 [Roseateles aquatilis]|uniref:Histidine kinase/HSP90-like ATPase domain-containing protein n=1 Tax=Roseateles aquatilis TaxID=431061 RepID=A0A246IZ58_9BURK|nr:ATP-binding protein [Roseateles aquatilis]OWQ85631.1 hypothetical protein CDN99_21330 [Roseateles aquatilis]
MTAQQSIQFKAPRSLDLPSALTFAQQISAAPDAEEYVVDFSGMGHVEPFSMLLISSELRNLARRNHGPKLLCTDFKQCTYAAHMGFFRSFDLAYGNAPGQAKGSENYLPITIFDSREVEREAFEQGIEVGNQVESISKRMSAVLCGSDEGDLFDTLAYSIREIIRNVIEHSGAERFGICAQHWPTKKRVEVAILDRGSGLRSSLSRNPYIDVSDDKKALNYALMPAVSGKAFKGSRVNTKGNWANSGFGLYMTNRICRNGGNFFIASGATSMLLTRGQGKRYYDCSLDGTAVRMVIDTSVLTGLRDALGRYREEGYEIQRKYKEIVSIDPSSASLMLSEDFDVSVVDRILVKLKRALG